MDRGVRRSVVWAGAIVLGVLLAGPAPAQDDGWYAGVIGGLNLARDAAYDSGTSTLEADDDKNAGWAVGGVLGYDFQPLRLELELMHRDNGIDAIDFADDGGLGGGALAGTVEDVGGQVGFNSLMINALYDVDTGGGLTPFVGGGLGLGRANYENITPGGVPLVDDEDAVFALQGIAGVATALTRSLELTASYRYLWSTRSELAAAAGNVVEPRYRAHSFLVGLVYRFGAPAPDPAPVRPQPAPQAAAANLAPVAGDDRADIAFGQPGLIAVLANDRDPDGDPLTVTSADDGAHGRVTVGRDGTVRYTPDAGFSGADRFSYTVGDGRGGESTASVAVTVAEPAGPPGPFIVFFEWDSAELTAQARTVVTEAAEAYRQFGVSRVSVVGHTDRSGSGRYNTGLALRRAEAVRDALQQQGVDPNAIDVAGRGEDDPLIATADDAREPQNRRVTIELGADQSAQR